eukprot:6842268-Prymnesium_polylepis.1
MGAPARLAPRGADPRLHNQSGGCWPTTSALSAHSSVDAADDGHCLQYSAIARGSTFSRSPNS